jgi:hypothetical protein
VNVRVHKRDFTTEDFSDVERITESWRSDVVLEDAAYVEIARFDKDEITSVEIRA